MTIGTIEIPALEKLLMGRAVITVSVQATLLIQISALDRLLNYLEAAEQAEVNTIAAQVVQFKEKLKQSNDQLQAAVQTQTK